MTAPLCLPDALDTYLKDFCNPNKSDQTKAERREVTWKENQSRNLIWKTEPLGILPLKSGVLQQLSSAANRSSAPQQMWSTWLTWAHRRLVTAHRTESTSPESQINPAATPYLVLEGCISGPSRNHRDNRDIGQQWSTSCTIFLCPKKLKCSSKKL